MLGDASRAVDAAERIGARFHKPNAAIWVRCHGARLADIGIKPRDVRFVPKADISVSFDDFVGTGRYCPRDFDIKRMGRALD
jgi:hypothetical protein